MHIIEVLVLYFTVNNGQETRPQLLGGKKLKTDFYVCECWCVTVWCQMVYSGNSWSYLMFNAILICGETFEIQTQTGHNWQVLHDKLCKISPKTVKHLLVIYSLYNNIFKFPDCLTAVKILSHFFFGFVCRDGEQKS